MKIEKNIPMERDQAGGAGRPPKYPFANMEIGDSIFVEGAKIPCKEYIAAQQFASRHGWKFSGRRIDGGVRIWRIE